MVDLGSVGGGKFFFRIGYGENHCQIADKADNRDNDASYGALGDKGESGEQHHEGHDAHSTGLLGGSHAAKMMVVTDVFAQP